MSRLYEDPPGDGFRVRPYALTGGRTRPSVDLSIETLVFLAPGASTEAVSNDPNHRAILDLVGSPISVAEISAHTHQVLGVTRVLVGDLVAGGVLQTHGGVTEEHPTIGLLERVLDGLQSL